LRITHRKLANLQQKWKGGTSKGQLMDAVDGLVNNLDSEQRNRFVVACIEEMTARNSEAKEELEKALKRVGWGISGSSAYPLQLQVSVETADLSEESMTGISTALSRYREGDFDGAITAICGAVDSQTETIYAKNNLGDHKAASYQERISKSFSSMEGSFKAALQSPAPTQDDLKLIWSNHQKAISCAGYVLGAFRRDYSDVHGAKDAPKQLVQSALDCAVFIIRSLQNAS
jgi:hypothetical protein